MRLTSQDLGCHRQGLFFGWEQGAFLDDSELKHTMNMLRESSADISGSRYANATFVRDEEITLILRSRRHVWLYSSSTVRRLSRFDRRRAGRAGCHRMPQPRPGACQARRRGDPQRQRCLDGRCQGRGIVLGKSSRAVSLSFRLIDPVAPIGFGPIHQARPTALASNVKPFDIPRVGGSGTLGTRHSG